LGAILGDLLLLDDRAVVVDDRLDRTDVAADAAVDAELRVDDVELFLVAGDALRRAHLGARRAPDAVVHDEVRHVAFVSSIEPGASIPEGAETRKPCAAQV